MQEQASQAGDNNNRFPNHHDYRISDQSLSEPFDPETNSVLEKNGDFCEFSRDVHVCTCGLPLRVDNRLAVVEDCPLNSDLVAVQLGANISSIPLPQTCSEPEVCNSCSFYSLDLGPSPIYISTLAEGSVLADHSEVKLIKEEEDWSECSFLFEVDTPGTSVCSSVSGEEKEEEEYYSDNLDDAWSYWSDDPLKGFRADPNLRVAEVGPCPVSQVKELKSENWKPAAFVSCQEDGVERLRLKKEKPTYRVHKGKN